MKLNKLILDKAIEKIRKQEFTPKSPCSRDSQGGICLCLAAAVASAVVEINYSSVDSKIFEKELKSKGNSLIDDTFEYVGLGRNLCDSMKRFNDSIPHERRKEEVINYLQALYGERT